VYDMIVVPLDGSVLAEVALPYAEELAGRLGSEVTLLYVSELTDGRHQHMGQSYLRKVAADTEQGAKTYLEAPPKKSIRVKSVTLSGDPPEEIVRYADSQESALIVMATHGLSGIKRWAVGSVADKVARATERPVVLIRGKGARPDVREKSLLNTILVPLDGSTESEAVLPYVEGLASQLGSSAVLLQVIPAGYQTVSPEGFPGYIAFPEDQMESTGAYARDHLNKVCAGLKQKQVSATAEVRSGVPANEIMKLADEINADLVAMSTHGRSGVGRLAFGSVADRVLHDGNTPLLLVRPVNTARPD
jgi:nucleotide-binding universal stress UspA family protein